MDADTRADRLRIACQLLAPRKKDESTIPSPLSSEAGMAAIRAMAPEERENLSACIDWVRDYEAHEC